MTHSSFLQDELKISSKEEDNKVTLKLEGALSATTVPYFRQTVQPYLDRPVAEIILDFAGVTKVVSRGVGAAIDVAVQIKKIGGRMRVENIGKFSRSLYIQGVHLVADVPELEGFEP
ncbi:MAG: STAS domain-containing protein [Pseudanabaenaceae cyanobacterium]